MSHENATMIQRGLGLGEVVQLAVGFGVLIPTGSVDCRTWTVFGLYGVKVYAEDRATVLHCVKYDVPPGSRVS